MKIRTIAPRKRYICRNLDEPIREYLDDISSPNPADNFYSSDFSSETCWEPGNTSPRKCKSIKTVNSAMNKKEWSRKPMFSMHVRPIYVSQVQGTAFPRGTKPTRANFFFFFFSVWHENLQLGISYLQLFCAPTTCTK